MNLSPRGSVHARSVAMVLWVVLLLGAFQLHLAIEPRINGDFLRWVVDTALLAAAIGLGFLLQRRVIGALDPRQGTAGHPRESETS